MSAETKKRNVRRKRARQKKKLPCHLCSRGEESCACGQVSMGKGRCSQCPKLPCSMWGHPPRCATCWHKMPLMKLCNECRCNFLTGCRCSGERSSRMMCRECYDSHPNWTLPDAEVISEPPQPDRLAWYEHEIWKWAGYYLEMGISRPDLLNLLKPCGYFDIISFEWYNRSDIQEQAVIKAFQRQDSLRSDVLGQIICLNIFPKPLAQLIAKLTVP
jgi:hypothetical protein